MNRRNLEPSTHRHADHPGKVLTRPNGARTVALRHNWTMVGGGGVSPADEQLVARFSGRLEDRVARFVGRPHADQWVWDEQLMVILGYSGCGDSASLQTLLERVADNDRQLPADAFRAAVEHGDEVWCRVASMPPTAASARC